MLDMFPPSKLVATQLPDQYNGWAVNERLGYHDAEFASLLHGKPVAPVPRPAMHGDHPMYRSFVLPTLSLLPDYGPFELHCWLTGQLGWSFDKMETEKIFEHVNSFAANAAKFVTVHVRDESLESVCMLPTTPAPVYQDPTNAVNRITREDFQKRRWRQGMFISQPDTGLYVDNRTNIVLGGLSFICVLVQDPNTVWIPSHDRQAPTMLMLQEVLDDAGMTFKYTTFDLEACKHKEYFLISCFFQFARGDLYTYGAPKDDPAGFRALEDLRRLWDARVGLEAAPTCESPLAP